MAFTLHQQQQQQQQHQPADYCIALPSRGIITAYRATDELSFVAQSTVICCYSAVKSSALGGSTRLSSVNFQPL